MTKDEFALAQEQGTRSDLSTLVTRCKRRFLKAAHLVNAKGQVIDRIERSLVGGLTDLTPLLPAWRLVCERYRDDRYDPQENLFQPHEAEVLERWGQFVYWSLLPSLLREDEFVRNVLRALELLPSRSPTQAADAVFHHIAEMNLPCGTGAWDYPEETD